MSIEQNNRRKELHNLKKEPLLELAVSLGCDVAMRSRKNIIHQILQKEAQRAPKQTEVQQEGKTITTTEHEGGRKDVHIEVKMLDVKETDPATIKAKGVIEKEILPKLANAEVLVIVVHKPSNDHAQFVCKLPQVRERAELVAKEHIKAIKKAAKLPEGVDFQEPPLSEYIVVEHHLTNGTVKVTTLV